MDKIKLGISSCLTGEKVRYDGQHKLDHYLMDILGKYVEYVPVCPEVECGMSVPREAMRLVGDPASPRLMTIRSGIDKTAMMNEWIARKLDELAAAGLCGFVFKSRSPSSGMAGVKVYARQEGGAIRRGSGLFAAAFMARFPLLPVEDEGRLNDDKLRENFIERIYAFARWREFERHGASVNGLMDFHARHKLLLMARRPVAVSELGRIIAGVRSAGLAEAMARYFPEFMRIMALMATVKKNVNVLEHILGYFKKDLTSDEKAEMQEVIDRYHRELIPLIVPVTLFNHLVRKCNKEYLREQYYLHPHPDELRLRNHV